MDAKESDRPLLEMHEFWGQLAIAMWAGARLRCPVCGKGHIFRSLVAMNKRCEQCGTVFEPEPGDFAGGLMLAMGVTGILVTFGALALEMLLHLSLDTQVWIWGVFTCVFLVVGYPVLKGAWLGFLHTMRRMR